MFKEISIDTETTGLEPYKKDYAFGISIGCEGQSFWFNMPDQIEEVKEIIMFTEKFCFHNAKFDLAFLEKLGIDILDKEIHCSLAIGRVDKFNLPSYTLDYLATTIGEKKLSSVKDYCLANGLWEWITRPGKKKREKNFFFSLVPMSIVEEYAKVDAEITYKLYKAQKSSIISAGKEKVMANENRLIKTLYKMERVGIKINREFVEKAYEAEKRIIEDVSRSFEAITKIPFKDSNKTISEAYEKHGYNYSLTEKGNPSFSATNIKTHNHDIATAIKAYRKAHARAGTYESILHYSDENDILHPNCKQHGCVTGRMSYTNPPIQCMEKVEKDDEDYNSPYLIRRSFVPREGYCFVMMDFDQFEYRMMLNYAEETTLIDLVKQGIDVHQATADILNVTRRQAKTINFALLYGTGKEALAQMLGISVTESQALKAQYFNRLPKVKRLIQCIHSTVEKRGYITNWLGRKYHLRREEAYKAPNYLIQGGTSDWVKCLMNMIDTELSGKKSRMLLQIHDELLFEIHETELHLIPSIKHILENGLTHPLFSHLRFTVGVDFSAKSWQDKKPFGNL